MSPCADAAGWGGIDWSQPWYTPWRGLGEATAARLASAASVAAALNQTTPADTAAVSFVDQQVLPAGQAYEQFIFDTRTVPTRDNLHDFFNGLAWLHFPQAKRRLNALQAGEIARAGVGATRGALRDALTLFDENGAVLEAPSALWQALLARDWQRLFVTERGLWQQARLRIFGHALLEKLVSARKPATAHILLAPAATYSIADDDAVITAALGAVHLASKPFVPLPVLGVPGWWAPNRDFSFYDDPLVFRPRKTPTLPL